MSEHGNDFDKPYLRILESLSDYIYVISSYIKHFLSVIILVAIILSFWSLPRQFSILFDVDSDSLIEFLEYVINMIIALELIEVLSHRTLDTIVEILLMALTRELIIQKMGSADILLGIIGIAILFGIRKYLYIPVLDKITHGTHFKNPKSKHADTKTERPDSAETTG